MAANVNSYHSYTLQIPISQLLAIHDRFEFFKFYSHPPGLTEQYSTNQPDYETFLSDGCSCSSCASGTECGELLFPIIHQPI